MIIHLPKSELPAYDIALPTMVSERAKPTGLLSQYEKIVGKSFASESSSSAAIIPTVNDTLDEKGEKSVGEEPPESVLAQKPLEIKHIMEVPDGKGGTTVLSMEDYQRRKNKRKDPEKVLRESPLVLRRVVRGPGIIVAIKLEIHSTELRELFGKIGGQFRELHLQTDPIIIFRPYRCLFFLREELERLANSTTDEVSPRLKAELKVLVDFIHSDDGLKKVIKSYNELIPQKKVTFDILWTIFPPFELVYDLDNFRGRLWITEYTQLERMDTTYLTFSLLGGTHNGSEFGIHRQIFQIAAFRGVVTISTRDLHHVPLRFLSETEQSEIKSTMLKQGKQYVHLQSSKFTLLHHDGPVGVSAEDGGRHLTSIEESWLQTAGRVVVDVKAAAECLSISDNPSIISANMEKLKASTKPTPSTTSTTDNVKDAMDIMSSTLSESDQMELDLASWSLKLDSTNASESKNARKIGVYNAVGGDEVDPLSNEDYMICSPSVLAFLLDKKIWAKLYLRNLTEIAWRPSPFDFLQLEAEKKTMVKDLVENYDSEEAFEGFDDIVQGKGKGLIFLLHGEPGLGKTLTAETIAEHTKRPLYYLTTGELDLTDVTRMEAQLQRAFRFGWRWGAVVLIDEADVIMSKRTTMELQRNAIVAVFLRLMEYYRGLLFLTTNRIDDFDNAFHNRIHVTIKYENLTAESRRNIWKSLLRRLVESVDLDDSWSEEAIAILGELDINGRDVRNLIRTAYGFVKPLRKVKVPESVQLTPAVSHEPVLDKIEELEEAEEGNDTDRQVDSGPSSRHENAEAPHTDSVKDDKTVPKKTEDSKASVKKVLGLRHLITVLRINLPKEKTGETVEKLEALLKQGQETVTLLDFMKIDSMVQPDSS